MIRREFLRTLGAVAAAPLRAAAGRPNVVFFISDQLHHSVLGVAGNPIVKTPNIDRLAKEGVRFEHAVCPTPFCSPSRATMLTGLYPHRHGITYNVGDPARGLNPKLPSTEQVLFGHGYQCGQKGKWHLGDKTTLPAYAHDPELDYAEFLGARKRRAGGVTETEVVKQALARYNGEKGVSIGRSDIPIPKQQESWIADTAIKQMQGFAGKPFFMTVSFPAPHAPWIINEPYYSMYERSRFVLPDNRKFVADIDRKSPSRAFGELLGDEGFREYLAVYYGMVSMMDWNVGRVLEALGKMGQERNTLVVMIADHGDMQGGHLMYGKLTRLMYEETTRIPLVLRYPGKIAPGKVVQTQVGTADVSPTILDYLGSKPAGPLHGRSLRPFIEGKEELDRAIYSEHERGRDGFQRMIRTLQWKYVYCAGWDSQLYNLEKDPGETRNLVDDSSARAVKQKLHAQLAQWMRETGDPRLPMMPKSV